jgi:cell wall-associated NlpC family hydrolase
MSLEVAISRIDQIAQLQQQLFSTGTGAASVGTTTATGGVALSPDFATALAGAQAASAPASVIDPLGDASQAPVAVQAMIEKADSLVGQPYVWGGGHSGWGPTAGYDCSGFVSAVLHAGGYLSSPQDTQTLPSAAGIESGPGQYVTIYDRTDATSHNDHVIIDLGGQWYESGGQAGSWGGGGGVEQISAPSAAYLASFNQILHPEGL